ncbi:hypothetical protein CL655_01610 [bacterium]|nr:hypothetical protein [bacterium]
MSITLRTHLLGSIAALALMFAIAPMAFAEETGDTDWETKAGDKIELVEGLLEDAEALIDDLEEDSDDRAEAEEDLAEAEADLDEAIASFDAEEYEDAYEEAVDAYEEVSELIDELTEDATEDEDDDDEDMDEDEDEDEDEEEDDKSDRCDRPGVGNKRYCETGDARKVPHAVKCKVDMLRDGERDRKFCRNGEWVEKREARLDDIMDGFIAAGDLDDEEAEAIRAEIQELIRKLIMLILLNR